MPSLFNLFTMSNRDNPYQLSLLITERCNLRCSYCYCDKRRTATMSVGIARQAIDDAMATHADRPLRLLLMGGEPFLEFGLVKEIVEYIRLKYPDRDVFVKTVTNGTLVHGEVQQWLMDNRDLFHASLSLDGSRERHNRNRCDSYDSIDIGFFLRTYGDNAEASMVACPESMDHVAEDVIALQEQGFRLKCVLADDCQWDSRRDPDRWATQLSTLVDYYVGHPAMMPFNQLMGALDIIGSGDTAEKCRPEVNTHCVDTDGMRFGCHRCTPYYNNGVWHLEAGSMADAGILHEGCRRCPALPLCCACPALVASAKGDAELGAAMCALFKVTHVANAVLLVRMFTECPDHIRLRPLDDNTKRDLITGAQTIINNLTI